MKFSPLLSALGGPYPLKQQFLVTLTCMTLILGCGNDGRENARAQLAQRGMTNSTAGFVKAVQGGDMEATRLFLQAGVNASSHIETTNGSFTALHVAVDRGNREMAILLLEKGVDVNATAFGKDTPLHIALARTNFDLAMVKLLVDNGANVNATREGGATPLMQAVFGGGLDVVNLLLNKGADVNAKETNGYTALMAASIKGSLAMVRALLKANPDLEAKGGARGQTAAEIAQVNGYEEIVAALRATKITPGEVARAEETQLKAREQLARLNLKFSDDFMRCVKNNDTLAVNLFLEAGMGTEQRDNVDGWTALQNAAYNGNPKMVQVLLDHGADVLASKDGDGRWRAEEIARERGYREVAELLLSAKKKFRASLGVLPGTYLQVEDTNDGAKTNEWVFTEEGTFRSYWGKGGKPDDLRYDGVYRLDGNKVLLRFEAMSGGQHNRQFTITETGLSDGYFRLVKSADNE
jgi:ankyrin repeat protein